MRKLEIGPSKKHLKGYETAGMEYADTKCDVSKRMPYDDGVFDVIVASHVIEHIVWHRTQAALTEWARLLKPGGTLEVWTPDLMGVIDIIVRAEQGEQIEPGLLDSHAKMMRQLNKDHDPYIWANYRIMAAEHPTAAVQYNRPHRSMFTFRHLANQMQHAGLVNVQRCVKTPPYDHGWAQLGVVGTKV